MWYYNVNVNGKCDIIMWMWMVFLRLSKPMLRECLKLHKSRTPPPPCPFRFIIPVLSQGDFLKHARLTCFILHRQITQKTIQSNPNIQAIVLTISFRFIKCNYSVSSLKVWRGHDADRALLNTSQQSGSKRLRTMQSNDWSVSDRFRHYDNCRYKP